ncbi:DEAD/DEAH box helicase family protein [Acidithiobacillus sp. MC6.1]|nr:DEAD/DEAH box helicase family protein [Acidithiobacillus sp. MC6.1]
MNASFRGWECVAESLCQLANSSAIKLNEGQRSSLKAIAKRLPKNGVIVADEVGMGKTRIAASAARAVMEAGGRVAILVPPGLGFQWGEELRQVGIKAPPLLRSLSQYLKAWENSGDPKPWFNEPTLVISQAFTNWRLGENSDPWRWALLPQLYAQWIKCQTGRFPRGFRNYGNLGGEGEWVCNAAQSIIKEITENHAARPLLQALVAANYRINSNLRPWLEQAVGLGLGVFDLIIIDEAHKSRGTESMLNRSLDRVVLHAKDARRLGLTATPVELDASQWTQMLERLQLDQNTCNIAKKAINAYKDAVSAVRLRPHDEAARTVYKQAADAFKTALQPFLLRRDKRQEEAIQQFQKLSGESNHAYRQEREIAIEATHLTPQWKQAVCAAEALSFVCRHTDDPIAQRLRLTLGNGHGIAALIDQVKEDESDDHRQREEDRVVQPSDTQAKGKCLATEKPDEKREQRGRWWRDVLVRPFGKTEEDAALYDHPAIIAAVHEIEAVCQRGEKVLVFGRFTRPMWALVRLLNAREMLRCLDAKKPWPQSKVQDHDWPAIQVAHCQLRRTEFQDRNALDQALDKQYKTLENRRRQLRERLIENIAQDFKQNPPAQHVGALFDAFKNAESSNTAEENSVLILVARALHELMGDSFEHANAGDYAHAFAELVVAVMGRGEEETVGESNLEQLFRERLDEEFSNPEGDYARLMYGETKPVTRRFLQLAFNRKHANPKVLVAQSLVGREGLNLHKACRTVVLLHPEWNPGVVEQQIGRVDRIGSLWEEMLDQYKPEVHEQNQDVPRIEIRPVIFRGTYDEHNWQVLRERWDEMRAQLHGVVISQRTIEINHELGRIAEELNAAAPCFFPE